MTAEIYNLIRIDSYEQLEDDLARALLEDVLAGDLETFPQFSELESQLDLSDDKIIRILEKFNHV